MSRKLQTTKGPPNKEKKKRILRPFTRPLRLRIHINISKLVSRQTKLRIVKMTLESRELRIPISLPRKKSCFEVRTTSPKHRSKANKIFDDILPAFKFLSDRARPFLFFFLFFLHRFDRSKHRRAGIFDVTQLPGEISLFTKLHVSPCSSHPPR